MLCDEAEAMPDLGFFPVEFFFFRSFVFVESCQFLVGIKTVSSACAQVSMVDHNGSCKQ